HAEAITGRSAGGRPVAEEPGPQRAWTVLFRLLRDQRSLHRHGLPGCCAEWALSVRWAKQVASQLIALLDRQGLQAVRDVVEDRSVLASRTTAVVALRQAGVAK